MTFLVSYAELIDCICGFIPLIPGYILFKKLTKELKLLIIILSICTAFNIAGYLTGIYYINNLLLYFFKYVTLFILYTILFKLLLKKPVYKRILLAMLLLFLIFIVFNSKHIYPPVKFDSYTPALFSFLMIIYCVFFFNQQLSYPQITFIYKTPWFWIVTGLLLYFAGSFLIMLTTTSIMYKSPCYINKLWSLQHVLNCIKNILIAISFFHLKAERWKK